MSEISVIGNAVVGTVQTTAPLAPAAPAAPIETASPLSPLMESGSAVTTDSVEFSEQSQLLEKIHDLPSVRQDRIDAIKDAIANDTYLTNNKVDVAIDRMIDQISE